VTAPHEAPDDAPDDAPDEEPKNGIVPWLVAVAFFMEALDTTIFRQLTPADGASMSRHEVPEAAES
jgi:hypothetical protein